jgi:hypothetical protein
MFGPRRAGAPSPAQGWPMLLMCTLAVYIGRKYHLRHIGVRLALTSANLYRHMLNKRLTV